MVTRKHDDEEERKSNSSLILTPGDVPGFQLSVADSNPASGRVIEVWVKPASDGSNRGSFIRISLFPFKNREAAISMAEKRFRATIDKRQGTLIGKPTPGSYSGQRIGDYCWTATLGLLSTPLTRSKSATLIAIQGDYLFRLQVVNPAEFVDDLFFEKIAKTIVSRLKNTTRPPGFCESDDHGGQDDF